MKILITGGSGFLGINLIRFLLKKGHAIVSLDIAEFDYPEKNKIEAILGDIRDQKTVDRALEGVDMVVHCAAALPLYSVEDIYTTDVKGTEIILTSSLRHKVKRVVHISSTAVYGIPDHHPLLETDKVYGVGAYGEAKVEAEAICRKMRDSGLCVSILRPKSFVGPERLGVFAMLYDWAYTGHNFPVLGNGKNLYQLLDVEDLCEAIYLCLTREEKLVNDTFNIAAEKFKSMGEDFQAVLDKAGHHKKIIPLPEKPIIAVLKVLEALGISPLYKWVYETAGKESFVSIDKAKKQLGYAPKYSNQDALLSNYQWYIDHLDSFGKASGVNHRVPWKQGALGIAKKIF